MTKVNVVQKLKEIAHSSPTAELVFTAFALKGRSRSQIDLQRFKTNFLVKMGAKVVDADYYQVFEELEKLGLGVQTKSSRGLPRKFRWYYNLRSVGESGLDGQIVPIRQLSRKKLPKIVEEMHPVEQPPKLALKPGAVERALNKLPKREMVMILSLKGGKVIRIDASEQFSKEELQEVSEIVKRFA